MHKIKPNIKIIIKSPEEAKTANNTDIKHHQKLKRKASKNYIIITHDTRTQYTY